MCIRDSHTVDDHPADIAVPVPGADEFSKGIKPACQYIGGIFPSFTGFGISGQAVIRHRCMKPHEAHVMVQLSDTRKGGVHFIFHAFSRQTVFFFSRGMIHLPQDSAPESIGPPAYIRFGQIALVAAVFGNIGNPVPHPGTFRDVYKRQSYSR